MLNNQSFNLMKALEEAEQMNIKKKIIVDSYHEELIESEDLCKKETLNEFYDPIESTLPDLASDLTQFSEDFDTYDFRDNYGYDAEAWEQALEDTMESLITEQGRQSIIDSLQGVIDDSDDNEDYSVEQAKKLIDRIKEFEKELEEYEETGTVSLKEESNAHLDDIENCTDARLGTIYHLAKEGIKWAKNHPQLKEITAELKRRGLIEGITFTNEDGEAYKELTRAQYLGLGKRYGEKVNNYNVKELNGKFYMLQSDYDKLTKVNLSETGLYEAKEVEYISKEDFDKMPKEYKSTVGETIGYAKFRGEDPEEIRKLYKDLGYDESDPMILARSDKGTILKPVKIKESCEDLKEENTDKISKEERLASLKTQLETDGDKMNPEEKKAVQEEIANLETELNESCDKTINEAEESENKENAITEQEVSNLKQVKNQGNIFMLQDDSKFIVGENYNEAEALIENAEMYDNKEQADKDYLGRCEITKDGEPAKLDESAKLTENDEPFDNVNEANLNLGDVNYKLPSGKYIHFHNESNGEGYYYEIYENGKEVDGGILIYSEVDAEPQTEQDILRRIAELSGIEEIADATEKVDQDVIDSFNESANVEEHNLSKDLFGDIADERMKQKQREFERDLQYVKDIMAGKEVIDNKYHEKLNLDTAKKWLRNDYVYLKGFSSLSPEEIDEKLARDLPEIFGK